MLLTLRGYRVKILGVPLWWIGIPSRGGGILLVTSCYGNWDKLWLDGPLGLPKNLPSYLKPLTPNIVL